MERFLNILASLLLLFNGIGAIYGGWNLMAHPDGSSIQLSMEWLNPTPFTSYLLPGLVLFIFNGLMSFFVLGFVIMRHKLAPGLIQIQGIILSVWILVQIMMIQTVYFLHWIMLGIGLLLILIGRYIYILAIVKKQV
jgi:hypothetical protein